MLLINLQSTLQIYIKKIHPIIHLFKQKEFISMNRRIKANGCNYVFFHFKIFLLTYNSKTKILL